MKKHILFLLTALTLLAALFPAAVSAAGTTPYDADADVGELAAGNSDYYDLGDVFIDGDSVSVEVLAEGNCSLVVGLYDENGKMTAARSAEITPPEYYERYTVTFDGEIGADLHAKAFLLDAATCAPLCSPVDDSGIFPVEKYALVDRIWLETEDTNVVCDALVYGQSDPTFPRYIGLAASAPRVRLVLPNGTTRTYDLEESMAYLSRNPDDAKEVKDSDGNSFGFGRSAFNGIYPDYRAGQIVRYLVNRDGYCRLHAINYSRKKAYSAVGNLVSNRSLDPAFGVQADSYTKFVVNENGYCEVYTGIDNVPDIANATAYAYLTYRDDQMVAPIIYIFVY